MPITIITIYVQQQYLPDELVDRVYYEMSDNGERSKNEKWMQYIRRIVMNKRGIVTIILSVILSLQICGLVTKADSNDSTNTANTSIVTSGNMRGVWVATTANLDYPTKATTDAAALKKEADTILDNIKAMNCNAVFFQVRQASDSLYKSNIFPWM